MKKIIIVSHNFPPESVGAASRIHEMAKLLKNFFDVNIICPPPTYPFTKYEKAKYFFRKENLDGLKIIRIHTFQPSQQKPTFTQRFFYYVIFPLLTSFALLKLLHKTEFVIIGTPPSSLLIVTLVIRLFRKKFILDIQDLWTEAAVSFGYAKKDGILTKLTKKFEIHSWNKADLIIANSVLTCDIIKEWVDNPSKVKYFPFNVDLNTFRKLDSTESEKRIVYIGNFGVAQDLQVFIKSLPIIVKKIPDLTIRLYGGGDCEEEIKKLAKDLDIESHVTFFNPIPRDMIPVVLSESTLGIVPLANNKSLRYAIPTKTFEYFACGLPVVAYGSSNELRRIIDESKGGVYADQNDPTAIANQIIKLITNKEELKSCSFNGRKFIEHNVDYSFFLKMANIQSPREFRKKEIESFS